MIRLPADRVEQAAPLGVAACAAASHPLVEREGARLARAKRAFTAGSFTTTNSQFWAFEPVGALIASSSRRRSSASSTGSGFRRRIARCVVIASSSGISRPAVLATSAPVRR